MAHPKRKTSRSKVRMRKASKQYKGIQINVCPACKEPALPHQVCKACGTYKGRQVLSVD